MFIGILRKYLPQSANAWFVLALLVFFIGLSVQYTFKVSQLRDSGQTRSAILRWKTHLLAVDSGDDGATDAAYPNPPIMALLLSPLARLEPLPMALTWFYLKVAMTLAALFAVFHLVADANRPFPAWAKALTVLLSLHPIVLDLKHGNVNLFILFLLVAAFFAYQRGRGVLAGLTLGLAIACKLTPALFLPYLLWKRSWRALGGCLAGVVLFLYPGVVPALALGTEENQHQLQQWYRSMVYPYAVENKVWSEHNNQSLVGTIFRLTTHSPSDSTYDENKQYVPTEYANVLNLERGQARWLVLACELLFAGVVVWCCRTPPTLRTGWRINAEFAMVTLGMLLFSERTWKHHCVTLLLPFAVLCYQLATGHLGRWMRVYVIGSLGVVAVLMTLPSIGGLNEPMAKQSEIYGVYVIGYVVLLAALAVTLRRARSAEMATLSAGSTKETVEPLAA
jgi:alpha-1,2-mannosyltransferase